jgi:predicted nucleotide-binding protein
MDILIEIYKEKKGRFIEIVVSFLTYYSRYNRDLRDYTPIPIDNELMRAIGFDLLDLGYNEPDISMYFDMAGYDLEALLSIKESKPAKRPEATHVKKVAHFGPAIPIASPKEELVINKFGSIETRLKKSNKIFIVHGHDGKIKNEVEEFLRSLHLDPIILHKQASLGKTIIEKVEHYSDVGFAVIVLTGDDRASKYVEYVLSDRPQNPTKEDLVAEREHTLDRFEMSLKPRARQNVIFEFGYFIGKLGRNKVVALCQEKVERPSDIDGLIYIPLDNKGEWKKELKKEIEAAGIQTDVEKL